MQFDQFFRRREYRHCCRAPVSDEVNIESTVTPKRNVDWCGMVSYETSRATECRIDRNVDRRGPHVPDSVRSGVDKTVLAYMVLAGPVIESEGLSKGTASEGDEASELWR